MVGNIFSNSFISIGSGFGQDAVKIGANLEMTGSVAAYGQMINEGIELIRDIVGTEVLGKQVEYVLVDNKSDKGRSG